MTTQQKNGRIFLPRARLREHKNMPRRKIARTKDVKAIRDAAQDLPDLTDQQMEFVRGICAGMTASDAYRASYGCSDWSPNSIWCAASKLRADTKVQQWIAAARIAHLDTAVCTRENHLAELARLKEIAVSTGNVGAAVQAEQLRGKVNGHYVERFEDLTETDPLSTLDRIRKDLGDEVADMLASRANLTH